MQKTNDILPHHPCIVFHYEQSQDSVFSICISNKTIANVLFSQFQCEMARRDSFGGYKKERFKDKVDIQLQCSVCLKVLKDPVQCPNEHYFCRSCIQKSLRENSKACPGCRRHLTEETLTKPPRILMGFLQNLEIRCDHENRGCREFIKLEFLEQHVESCGYSPTRCTNVGCAEVMNRNEKVRHALERCEFRKIVCDECGERVVWKSSRVHPCFMRKEIDGLARKLTQVQLTQKEMAYLTKEGTEIYNLLMGKPKIFVCGGNDGQARLNSVESYSWPENSWILEPAMKQVRSDASAFVHGREIYVSGGCYEHPRKHYAGALFESGSEYREKYGRYCHDQALDSIESLNVDEKCPQWMESAIKMPIKCRAHKMVRHENSAILTGGRDDNNVSDGIYEVSLNPPYNTKVLTQMPEPRCCHGCEIIDNQVVVAGGTTSKYLKDAKNTVYVYDINNNKCKTLPPLPFGISEMATVSYKDNVILIGGRNEKSQTLNSVVMYDVKTGEIKMLPCLNHKRAGSAAVITGNVIIVMGGYEYETKTYLKSVEYLDLSTNVWRELSPMTTKRGYATAVLKPIS